MAAQVVIKRSASGSRVIIPDDVPPEIRAQIEAQMAGQGGPTPPPGAPGAAAVAANPRAQQRLQGFLQLKFDRRKSAILDAWRKPEPEPIDPDAPEPAEPEDGAPAAAGDAPTKDDAATEGEAAAQPVDAAGAAVADGAATAPVVPIDAEPAPDTVGPPLVDADAAAAAAREQAEQAAAAAAAAKAAAEQQAAEQKKQQRIAEAVARDLEIVARDVTLGRWDAVRAFLAEFDEAPAQQAYTHLLNALPNAPRQQPVRNVPPNLIEQNEFSLLDVIGIVSVAPGGLKEGQVPQIAVFVQKALASGHTLEGLLALFRAETAKPDGERVLGRRRAAQLLAQLGYLKECGEFLPTLDKAIERDDREAMNLLARHFEALHREEKKPALLEQAWAATQAALAAGEIEAADKQEALERAVAIAPRIAEELGEQWLEESFTTRPERGMEILATMGSAASRGFEIAARDPEQRLRVLGLQKTAVEALLEHASERAGEWEETLELLAENWLAEALHSYQNSEATSLGPMMERDYYGNVFYRSFRSSQSQMAPPIEPTELLELRPGGRWFEMLDEDLRPKYSGLVAQLYLKVNEPDDAFPYIEDLCRVRPSLAENLVAEFLRVWMRNNNPNQNSGFTDPYMFMYGFNRQRAGIPLTRSKQERNLEELSGWVARLRALPEVEIDEDLLLQAFVQSHSVAEVFSFDAIMEVFGALDSLSAKTIAGLAQTMRSNLAGIWREPETQQNAKTRRRQRELEAEVLRGYDAARALVSGAAVSYPEDWRLKLAEAAIRHDANDFRSELGRDSNFASERGGALDDFAAAAELYIREARDLGEKDWSTEAFDLWFYAGLGACDLGEVDQYTRADIRQPARIRAALDTLPDEAREWHLGRMARNLFNRMSGVNPSVKVRYLEAGFEIVGDHEAAAKAREVHQYYKDLVTEVRLATRVDGRAEVGHRTPFGLRVDLEHTLHIERESGGFGKYLQNQNSSTSYSFNYGRPTENYRDKFEEAARQALGEQFEVLSVTFNKPEVKSKPMAMPGWKRTPYAYLLLKARGPEVDKIPALQIDVDFLDTSGYAVIPVASAELPIDAGVDGAADRPYSELEVTQVLDEREADKGELGLEIRATASGLVPEFDDLVDADFADFDVVETDDPGLAVSAFADDGDGIVSERIWTLKLKAREQLTEAPRTFRFAAVKDGDATIAFQRYDDADLTEAEPVVELQGRYVEPEPVWPWIVLGVVVLLVGGFGLRAMARSGGATQTATLHALPEHLTPFRALELLHEVAATKPAGSAERQGIEDSAERIQRFYFGGQGDEPDVRALVEQHLRARAS